jgi:fructose-1,6-bisphosphatase
MGKANTGKITQWRPAVQLYIDNMFTRQADARRDVVAEHHINISRG